MKTKRTQLLPAALVWLAILVAPAGAQLTIPGDGSDGIFNPTESVEIDLSEAVTGNWNDNNAANAGKGIYDKNQWAVVFKYQSVTIPAGVSVTFKNHPSRAPVVWLVQGNVTIIGPGNGPAAEPALNLNGKPVNTGDDDDIPAEPGPGGFRGGAVSLLGNGAGLGPGGGGIDRPGAYHGAYGNPQIVPLIGGSGAGGAGQNRPGASGGGAILIACSETATLAGRIEANGGLYAWQDTSGGAVRIVANAILGDGKIEAHSRNGTRWGSIRLEANSLSPDITTLPETIAVLPAPTPIIFPPANAPKVRILSVAGVAAPDEPLANLTTGADIGIQSNDAVEIEVETTNFPIEGLVQVRVAYKFGAAGWGTATYQSGNNARATWRWTGVVSPGFSTWQARATAP